MTEPIEENSFYVGAEVARILFRHSRDWFYRHRRELEALGFPRPISPIGMPRWRGSDLLAWRATEPPAKKIGENCPRATIDDAGRVVQSLPRDEADAEAKRIARRARARRVALGLPAESSELTGRLR